MKYTPVELGEEDTLTAWTKAKFRMSDERLQIKYKNKWLNVAREDSCGDVCSWYVMDSDIEKQKAAYEERMWGAFVYHDTFAVIDSATDG